MSIIREQLTTWREGLLLPNHNDVLLNLILNKNALEISEVYHEDELFFIAESLQIKKFYKENQLSLKETGSNVFGIIYSVISFSIEEKEYNTPFLLAAANLTNNRFNNQFEIQQTEDFYVNPVLLTVLNLESLPENSDEATLFLQDLGLEVQFTKGYWVANFHPHRFVLQKELDELAELPKFSESLKSLFGETHESIHIALSEQFLLPADQSQRLVLQAVENQNLVIQGPPGTGKSQVIVNLVGKTLGKQLNSLVIAEKSVALQVILDQLKTLNLHYFCGLYHHELKAKHFIQNLKNTWHFLENLPKEIHILGEQSKLLTQGLDFTMERLRQNDLIGGISFADFKKQAPNLTEDNLYLSKKPTIKEWESDKKLIQLLLKNQFPVFSKWTALNFSRHSLVEIEEKLNQTIVLFANYEETITLNQFNEKQKLTGLVSLFYYDDIPIPEEFFQQNSKSQKQFLKFYNQLKTLIAKQNLLKEEEKHWNKTFSLSELQEYITALSTTNRFNIRHRITRKKLLKFTDLNLVEGKKALENMLELKQVEKELISTKEKLRKLKISDDLATLDYVFYAIQKLQAVDDNSIKLLLELNREERNRLKNLAKINGEIQHNLRYYFSLNEDESIVNQLSKIKQLIPLIAENLHYLSQIQTETKEVLKKAKDIDEVNSIIYFSHWSDFKGRYPELAKLSNEEIQYKIEEIISIFDQECIKFSAVIQQQVKEKFDTAHNLLQTPARKLSEEQKLQKKNFRKGKSILVKAFDKKRVFPSVRELLESEAKYWIQILHPIFFCSPYSLAKSFPIDFHFDVSVFDEASQIPLSHVVGAVQRSSRVVICGDQQQMAPQFFFQKKSLYQSDALHHASFYWENRLLRNHYRSLYPELIAFSNRYFYEDKLNTFPVFGQKENAIELITTEGRFVERKNEIEAKTVADIVAKKVDKGEFNFGLVAFSQIQLETILSKLSPKHLDLLANKSNVFVQTLENVQGDECEHLIISMGYGKDVHGVFHKRFGPLNQEQGYRRLNVLMSRAKSKITFVRSVTSEDFSLSDNEGVELLRKLMLFLEQTQTINYSSIFPNGITQKDNALLLSDFSHTFQKSQELIDFYRVSKTRGWDIKF